MPEEIYEEEEMEAEQQRSLHEFIMEEESLPEHEMEFFEFTEDMQSGAEMEIAEDFPIHAEGESSPETVEAAPEIVEAIPEEMLEIVGE